MTTTMKVAEAATGSGKTAWAAATPYVMAGQTNPRHFGLPHDTWRRHQLDTLRWLTNDRPGSVVSLVKTKNLQASNYEHIYGFAAHYGRANYECVHPAVSGDTMCDECLFLEDGMYRCPYASECIYLLSKARAMGSDRASLNYPYWMTARGWRRNSPPAYLYCDEAHNLSEVVLDFVGCTVTAKHVRDYDLPDLPRLTGDGGGVLLKAANPVHEAMAWLERAKAVVAGKLARLRRVKSKRLRHCDRLYQKLSNTMEALQRHGDDWYIRSGPMARSFRGRREPGFVCKPLTARFHAPAYFLNGHNTVMMSATIGDPETLASELGVQVYDFRAVPNQWHVDARQVQVLDVPGMGRKAMPSDFEKQADEIASAILSCPPDWSGFVHVSRKREAMLLAERLARRGLQDRVFVPPGWDGNYTPTDRQMAAWVQRRESVPGSICVSWAFGEGVDGLAERICISAKVKYGYLGDDYVMARMRYNNAMYRQRAAWRLEQSLGRTRRGREQDYDIGRRQGLVCIADGSYTQVRKHLSQSLREALVE